MSLKEDNNNKKNLLGEIVTINDLKEKVSSAIELTPQQHLALKNFDRYKTTQLNAQKSETDFQKKYFQLQVAANLTSYLEFINERFCS